MTEDLRRFIDGAVTAAAAVARCEHVIERLEAENAQLAVINGLLVDKLEWFATYVGQPSALLPVETPRDVCAWPPRRDFVFPQELCRKCGKKFDITRGRRTLCTQCRGGITNAWRTRPAAQVAE